VVDQTKSRGGARAGAGRKAKPKIELSASKGMASRVLGRIDEEEYWLSLLRFDLKPAERVMLSLGEKCLIEDTLEYLTNRRDGKPAQGVFVGDTREISRDLDFGDLPFASAAGKPGAAHKPN
jgi:hypothetical protein